MLPEKSILFCLFSIDRSYDVVLFAFVHHHGEMVPCSLIFILQVLSLKMYRVKTVQL